MKDGKTLLLKKACGRFGEGKWNAPGGKIKAGERPEECVVREVQEETGLRVTSLKDHGKLTFFFGDGKEPDWIVHVFSAQEFEGNVKESEEGKLRWIRLEEIPYDEMWDDDKHWVPLMLKGKKFDATFYFDEDMKRVLRHEVNIINSG
jgi:8-oxo-dGTP diphosphatase